MSASSNLWCGHELLVTVRSPQRPPRVIHLPQPFARIGAHPKSDVVIEEKRFLRAFYLHATDDGIFCLNLDDSAGPHSSTRWLRPGRFAQVGQTRIEATFADAPEMSERDLGDLRLAQFEEDDAAQLQVRLYNQDQPLVVKRCRSPLTLLGRDKPAAIKLVHPMVSRTHCVLYWQHGRLWVVDLLSANRTLLNGEAITVAEVAPGHLLQLGGAVLSLIAARDNASAAVESSAAPSEYAGDHTMLEDEALDAEPLSAAATWTPEAAAPAASESTTSVGLTLKAENATLTAALAGADAKRAELEAACASLQTEISALRTADKQGRAEAARLRAAGKEFAERQAAVVARLEALQRDRDDLSQRLDETTAQRDAAASQERNLMAELEQVRRQEAASAEQRKALENRLDLLFRDYQSEQQTTSELEAQSAHWQAQYEQAAVELAFNNSATVALKEQLQQLQTQRDAARLEQTGLAERLRVAEADAVLLKEQLADAIASAAEAREASQKSRALLERQSAELEQQRAQTLAADERNQQAVATLRTLEADHAALAKVQVQWQQECATARQTAESSAKQCAALEQENRTLLEASEESKLREATLDARLVQTNSTLQTVRADLKHQQDRAAVEAKLRRELQSTLEDKQQQISDLKQSQTLWETEREELLEAIDAAAQQSADLRLGLQQAQQESEQARRRNSEAATDAKQTAAREKAHAEQVRKLEAAVAAAETQRQRLADDLKAKEAAVAELTEVLSHQQQQAAELAAARNDAAQIAGQSAQVDELLKAREQDQQRQTMLEHRLKQSAAREQTLSAQVQRQQAAASASEDRRHELELLLQGSQSRTAELEQAVEQWREQNEQANAAMRRETGRAAELQAQHAGLQQQRNQLLQQQADLQQKLAELEQRQLVAQTEKAASQRDAARLAELQARHEELLAQRGQLLQERDALKQQLDDLQDRQDSDETFSDRPTGRAAAEARTLPASPRVAAPAWSPLDTGHQEGGPLLATLMQARSAVALQPLPESQQDDDLIDRLMAYQTRGQAVRWRRILAISLGVAATILALGAMVWQSLSQFGDAG